MSTDNSINTQQSIVNLIISIAAKLPDDKFNPAGYARWNDKAHLNIPTRMILWALAQMRPLALADEQTIVDAASALYTRVLANDTPSTDEWAALRTEAEIAQAGAQAAAVNFMTFSAGLSNVKRANALVLSIAVMLMVKGLADEPTTADSAAFALGASAENVAYQAKQAALLDFQLDIVMGEMSKAKAERKMQAIADGVQTAFYRAAASHLLDMFKLPTESA